MKTKELKALGHEWLRIIEHEGSFFVPAAAVLRAAMDPTPAWLVGVNQLPGYAKVHLLSYHLRDLAERKGCEETCVPVYQVEGLIAEIERRAVDRGETQAASYARLALTEWRIHLSELIKLSAEA